jgi:ABC-2 type transport system permease protein
VTFAVNPVLDRELKERVRGRRSVIILTLFLLVLSVLTFFVAWGFARASSDPFASVTTSARTGRAMFEALVIAMLGLVCFITPGLTAASIAAERDRQTLVPMLVTLLKPRSILIGKLLAALAFLSLLIVAATPLLAVSVVFGGVTIVMVLKAIAAVLVTVVLMGSVSLLCSVFFRRVQTATLAAYACMLAMVIGPLFALAAIKIFAVNTNRSGPRVEEIATRPFILNPLVGAADLLRDKTSMDDPNSFVLRRVQQFVNPPIKAFNPNDPNGGFGAFGQQARRSRHGAFWVWWLVSSAVTSFFGILLATRQLKAPSRKTLDR